MTLAGEQLPTYPAPTVTLHREQLERFRAHYAMLLAFAADVCGVDETELCLVDVERWRHQHGLPVRDPLVRYWFEQARSTA